MAERHRLALVVRDVDGRDPEVVLQRGDVRAHLDAQLRVEVRERLVHQEDARRAHDRAAHRHALPLAARELRGLAVEEALEPEPPRDLGGALLALGLLDTGHLQREGDVLGDGEVRVERVVLEDHRDVALLRRQVGHVAAADQHRARVDLLQAREHPERRRLPRARRADEHHQLAVADIEVERIDGRRRAARVELRRLDVSDLSHARPPPRPRARRGRPAGRPRRRPARRGRAAPRRRSAASSAPSPSPSVRAAAAPPRRPR